MEISDSDRATRISRDALQTALLDCLVECNSQSFPVIVTALLLYGPHQISHQSPGLDSSNPPSEAQETLSQPIPCRSTSFNLSLDLHTSALKRIDRLIRSSILNLPSIPTPNWDSLIGVRELIGQFKDLAHLLALSPAPQLSFRTIDVNFYCLLSIHLISVCDVGKADSSLMNESLAALLSFYGSFILSRNGIIALATAFEDSTLEEMWVKTFIGNEHENFVLSRELRRSQGVYGLADLARQSAFNFDMMPQFRSSKLNLALSLTMFHEVWRISRAIVRVDLRDLEQIRRNSDAVVNACLELAKLCAYECGREALCAVLLESSWPPFLVALGKHSTSKTICDMSQYLALQMLQTGLQYQYLLSHRGKEMLGELLIHQESLAPVHSASSLNNLHHPQIDIILELLDHPHLLWTDNYSLCHLSMSLSSFASICAAPTGPICILSALSDRSIPYSAISLFAALLDELSNSISVLVHGEELLPGCLQYSRPPFPLPGDVNRCIPGQKLCIGDNMKNILIRCSISACQVILGMVQFRETFLEHLNDPRNRYEQRTSDALLLTKTCVRALKVCKLAYDYVLLRASQQFEGAVLAILSTLVSVSSQSDFNSNSSQRIELAQIVICEILDEGRLSPYDFRVSVLCLSFLTPGWKSEEVLINNCLVSSVRRNLQNLLPELSNWLLMWDGDIGAVQWLRSTGQAPMMMLWAEVLSRVEFWIVKRHWTYSYKWLRSLRLLLASCIDREPEIQNLQAVVEEQHGDPSLKEWLNRISLELPSSELPPNFELELLWRYVDGSMTPMLDEDHFEDADIDDIIHINCTDYIENLSSPDHSPFQRSLSPTFWRDRFFQDKAATPKEESQRNLLSGFNPTQVPRNGGGGKVYVQNEFRSAHGASRNTSRAPSIHVDDFHSMS